MSREPLTILIAGPYRSGTGDDPGLIAADLAAMNTTALSVLRLGHLPLVGEWAALPLIAAAGSAGLGDEIWEALFHPVAERVAACSDACLRIGGPSAGADAMAALFANSGRPVFHAPAEIAAAFAEVA